MNPKNGYIKTALAAAIAMGALLVMSPLAGPVATFAQSSNQSDGIERGLFLTIDRVREEVADLVEDANDDNDVEDNFNDLVDEIADDNEIEEDIQDSLDDVGSIMEDVVENGVQEVSDVLTEFTDGAVIVEEEDLPSNITPSSISAAVGSVSTEEVAEELALDAITDDVIDNNAGLTRDLQRITDEFIDRALAQPNANLVDLVEDVQDEIEDAVDEHISEDEVADVINDLSEDDVIDSINDEDVSIDAAVTKAVVMELEEPDSTSTQGTQTSSASENDALMQEIAELRAQVAELNAIIQSLTSGGNQTAPMTNSTTTR